MPQSTVNSFGLASAQQRMSPPAPPPRPHFVAVRPVLPAGHETPPVMLPEAFCPAQAESATLQPLMGLCYQRHPLSSLSGIFTVMLSLVNRSPHVAHEPFLCIPVLGLELAPASGWRGEEVSSVRRLRRFAPAAGHKMQTGERQHCCNILLAYDAREGGMIQYDFGTWHRVADLPDLRLTCVAGAGNFPSERLPLVVPALTLQGFFGGLVASGEIPAPVSAE